MGANKFMYLLIVVVAEWESTYMRSFWGEGVVKENQISLYSLVAEGVNLQMRVFLQDQ